MMHFSALVLFGSLCVGNVFAEQVLGSNIYVEEDCNRIRRPLHELDTKDLMLYVDGLQAIRANGKYQEMVETHHLHTMIHRGSSFFFYHTFFVWEVETQIRALGGKFKCFSLPYYDWTIEADREQDPWILNSVFGGDGTGSDHHHCVQGDLWNIERWPLTNLCSFDENPDVGCCLKRNLGQDIHLSTAEHMGDLIAENEDFRSFEQQIAYEHQMVHWLFAKEDCIACAMATGYSPDDPIFMVLHSGVAYLRALWATCHGYQTVAASELDEHPECYVAACQPGLEDDECDVIQLDEPYEFDNMKTCDWTIASRMDVTPRMLWDFKDWGVKYSPGDLMKRSGLEASGACSNEKMFQNNPWFIPPESDDDDKKPAPPGPPGKAAVQADAQSIVQVEETMTSHAASHSNILYIAVPLLGMMFVVGFAFVYKAYQSKKDEKGAYALIDTEQNDYGTVIVA
eukprot:CAMPEP_0202687660 /NCGR_PEP_ID=MMETSP1385-20130828/3312_1 /ASSEMBLY_ACC=CAM_ASM_000861 /TAXON_ID=933848 /ORGANISM="Elphidium margaritaceum" /LENGTH=454 /DNA_ID=CAMNT_0049342493 /DNA_START=8 /DNA_END=1372 /DNA_ORIENTATION=+